MTFELTSAGIKTFSVLIWSVQHHALAKDEVDLDNFVLDDFITAHSEKEPPVKLSLATFKRGLNELEKAKIIAKTIRQGRYYINPNFVFNGDRIAFTTLIERKTGSTRAIRFSWTYRPRPNHLERFKSSIERFFCFSCILTWLCFICSLKRILDSSCCVFCNFAWVS